MKYHVYKWNKHDKEDNMVILTEEDVEKESMKDLVGAGYEILVLPKKYENVDNKYLHTARLLATVRCGEVIYV